MDAKLLLEGINDLVEKKGISKDDVLTSLKEAIIKALYPLNITNVYLKDIEILNTENGIPYVKIKKYPNLNIKISLSHSKKYATATAIIVS